MYKNKCLFITFLLLMSLAQAQTIEEAAESSKNKQLMGLSSGANVATSPAEKTSPPVLPNDPNRSANLDSYNNSNATNSSSAKIPTGLMMVTSLYASDSWSQAGIDIDGTEFFVGLGDVLPGGWIVANINNNDVVLRKCNQSKQCAKKILTYTRTR
jgi:type IV pilus biogenesis protein PilP